MDGKAVTGSVETNGSDFKYKRVWKDGPLWAPVTGYSSQAFDSSQLESLEDGILTGNDDQLFFNRTLSMFTGEKKQGGNVVTTLNGDAQRAAFKGLGDKKGSVVALDPKSGAILALASTPSYDPSVFAGNSNKDSEARQKLLKDKDKPMLNRALRETYPPGSTFKVVTAAAALENGLYDDIDAKTDSPLPWTLPQTDRHLQNEGNIPCEDASLREALRWSCNTVFGKVSDDLGNEKMIEQTDKFGFNKEVFTPVRADASIYPEDNRPQNAMAGIGQASNRATPLQMAMVASAIANDGKLMQPYMVAERQAPNLDPVLHPRARGTGPRGLRGERTEAPADDGDRRQGRHGNQRADPRRHSGRQDRYRPARSEQQREAVRLVHLVREDRQRLPGRRRRRGRGRQRQPGRHLRWRPGRPHRTRCDEGGHRQQEVRPVTAVACHTGHRIPVGYRLTGAG
ncbi:Peptidoglycan D,D-transpeptidase MrdA [Streptomyces badius]